MPQRPARVVYAASNRRKRIILPDWYMPDLDPDDKPLFSECGKFWYDPEEAWRWVNWGPEYCVHVDGKMAGQPLEFMPWQLGPTRELFGWRRIGPGGELLKIRRYRKAFCGVPRKNSKTTWLAAIGLGMTSIDGEKAPQNVLISGTEKQTKENGFRMAAAMIQLSEPLRDDIGLYAEEDNIFEPIERGVLRALSATPKGKTGGNIHFLGVDELHEFPDNRLIHALWTGSIARDQPMLLQTTTCGEDPEGPWAGEWDYARDVMEGKIIDPTYFAVVYEIRDKEKDDADDYWTDRTLWALCNPGWGLSVNTETLEDIYKTSRTPDAKAKFQQFHLCKRQFGASDFLSMDQWDACFKSYTAEDLRGRTAYGGLDLASTRDMTNFALLFPYWFEDVVYYDSLLWSFCPKVKVTERDLEFKYGNWVDRGILIATEGDTTDYRVVRETIKQVKLKFDFEIAGIRFDDWHAPELVGNLQDEDKFVMVNQPQTVKGMGPATGRLEELILAKQFHHDGNPILRWNAGNARVVTDRNNNKVLSKRRSKEKIDGLAAVTIALSGAMIAPPPKKSVYEERGFLEL